MKKEIIVQCDIYCNFTLLTVWELCRRREKDARYRARMISEVETRNSFGWSYG